jgi:hypothetical protein
MEKFYGLKSCIFSPDSLEHEANVQSGGKPLMSSLYIYPEACAERGGGGRSYPWALGQSAVSPSPYFPADLWLFHFNMT